MADATPWRLEPDTLNLVGPPEPALGYTARQFDEQVWPPCPECGTMIEVDRIAVRDLDRSELLFIRGRIRCPRGCNLHGVRG